MRAEKERLLMRWYISYTSLENMKFKVQKQSLKTCWIEDLWMERGIAERRFDVKLFDLHSEMWK